MSIRRVLYPTAPAWPVRIPPPILRWNIVTGYDYPNINNKFLDRTRAILSKGELYQWWPTQPPTPFPAPLTGACTNDVVVQPEVVIVQNPVWISPPPLPRGWWAGDLQEPQFGKPVSAAQQQFSPTVAQQTTVVTVPEGWRGQQLESKIISPLPPAQQQFAAFEPQGFIQSTFPDGWRSLQPPEKFALPFPASAQQYGAQGPEHVPQQLDVEGVFFQPPEQFAKPFPATLQLYAPNFEPAGFIRSTFPEGWRWLQPPEKFGQLFPVAAQQYVAHQNFSVPTAVTPHGWEGQQLDFRFAQPVPAALQQYNAQGPEHVPAQLDVEGVFFQPPDLFAKPFPATLQLYSPNFQAAGFISSRFPEGWRWLQPPEVFAKPFPVQDQPFSPFPEPQQFLPGFGWWGYQLETKFAQPFPVAAQQYVAHALRQVPTAPTPQGWWGYQLDYLFAQPFPAKLQQFDAWPPQIVLAVSNTTTWRQQPLNPEIFAQPFPAPAQQYVAHLLYQIPTAPTPQGWWGYQFDTAFAKPFPVAAQPFTTAPAPQFFAGPSIYGWWGYQLDYAFAKPFPIADQPFTPAPEPQPFPPGLGWWGYQLETRFAQAFPASAQQYNAQPSRHVPTAEDVEGVYFQPPDLFAKPFPAAIQQYSAFQPQGQIFTVFPEGWRWAQPPEQFKALFPASAQQYVAHQNFQVPTATTPHGWEAGYQLEYRFAQPFPVQAQQFLAYIPEHVRVALDVEGVFFQPPDLFAKPFPAPQQQFNAFQAQGRITSTFPDGWLHFQPPEQFGKPFAATLQQYDAHAHLFIAQPVTFPEGWRGYQTHIIEGSVAVEAEVFFGHQGITPPVNFVGWQTDKLEFQFGKPVSASIQQYVGQGPRVTPPPPGQFNYPPSEVQFKAQFPVPSQQYVAQAMHTIPPPPVAAQSFNFFQHPDVFVKPFPAFAQQWVGQAHGQGLPPGPPPTPLIGNLDTEIEVTFRVISQSWYPLRKAAPSIFPEGWRSMQPPEQFAKPFAAFLQQFNAFQPLGTPPPFLPPGSGRRYFPESWRTYDNIPQPAWDKKPRKPIRPIWDRGGKVEEPKPQPQIPAAPPPLPPLSIFGLPGQTKIISVDRLPTFQEYSVPNPQLMQRRLQQARDESDALKALEAERKKQQEELEEAIAALKAMGLMK